MKAHIDAIKALLVSTGYDVYFADVPETPDYPYVLLWCSPGLMVADSLRGVQDVLDEPLGVTTVGANTDATLIAAGVARAALLGAHPTVAGRYVHELRLTDSRPVRIDRDVTLPDTNRHPSYGVDIYALKSDPAAVVATP